MLTHFSTPDSIIIYECEYYFSSTIDFASIVRMKKRYWYANVAVHGKTSWHRDNGDSTVSYKPSFHFPDIEFASTWSIESYVPR